MPRALVSTLVYSVLTTTVLPVASSEEGLSVGSSASSQHLRIRGSSAAERAESPAAAYAAGSAAQQRAAAGALLPLESGKPSQYARMNHILKVLGRFRSLAQTGSATVQQRHAAEAKKLADAKRQATDENVRQALNASEASNERTLAETEKVYANMVDFSRSMESLLEAATSKEHGCEQTQCGMHASCTDTTSGAVCVCNEGYVGTGTDCTAPPELKPHTLLFEGSGGTETQAADIHITAFEKNKIGIVFRDTSRANIGRIVLGSVREAGLADLSPPEQFTTPTGKAYSPVITGTDDGRIAIAWRSENRAGTGYVRGAALGTTNIRGASMSINWGTPIAFARNQAHKMAIVSLPLNRVAVMFSDKVLATQHTPTEYYGSAIFAGIDSVGNVSVGGVFRFADFAVVRLEATKVSSTAFIVAARGVREVDELEEKLADARQEALAIYGEVVANDLFFDPTPINLAPEGAQLWSRGVSLIAPNTFAYAYQDGVSMSIKMAVVEVNSRANSTAYRMTTVVPPTIIAYGFSPYVSMLSVPYTACDPHTLVYYEANGVSQINVCSWDTKEKTLSRCESSMWLDAKVNSVSGVHLGGGKAFMAFTPASGKPYTSAFAIAKRP